MLFIFLLATNTLCYSINLPIKSFEFLSLTYTLLSYYRHSLLFLHKGPERICSKSHEKNFFSIFCTYLVELSLGFQIMCRLCIYDSPFPSQGSSNIENNQIQYIAILMVFTLYLMLEFVQICRPYTFLIALSLLFNTSYDSILFILVGSNFNPIFLKNHRFWSVFSLWTCGPHSKSGFFGFK